MIGNITFDVFGIQFKEDTVQWSILSDGKSSQHHFIFDIIQAKIFRIASTDHKIAIWRDG